MCTASVSPPSLQLTCPCSACYAMHQQHESPDGLPRWSCSASEPPSDLTPLSSMRCSARTSRAVGEPAVRSGPHAGHRLWPHPPRAPPGHKALRCGAQGDYLSAAADHLPCARLLWCGSADFQPQPCQQHACQWCQWSGHPGGQHGAALPFHLWAGGYGRFCAVAHIWVPQAACSDCGQQCCSPCTYTAV